MNPETVIQDIEGRLWIAWAAGVFEGEGHCQVRKPNAAGRRPYASVRLVVSMTDRDVIERLALVTGVGGVRRRRPPHMPDHYKTQWTWATADRHECARLLNAWLPFLGERRRRKAVEALVLLGELEDDRHRVCYCGRPFYAERHTRRFCCEEHRAIWKHQERKLKVEA